MLRRRLLEYLRQKDLEVCTLIPRIDPPLMHPQDGQWTDELATNTETDSQNVKPSYHSITFLCLFLCTLTSPPSIVRHPRYDHLFVGGVSTQEHT